MGAWGPKPFENDAASEFLVDLEEAEDLTEVEEALEAVAEAEEDALELDDCRVAIAAAEIVAGLKKKPAEDLPEEALTWISEREAPPRRLVTLARAAVTAVKVSSELRDEWREQEAFEQWMEAIEDLEDRLA